MEANTTLLDHLQSVLEAIASGVDWSAHARSQAHKALQKPHYDTHTSTIVDYYRELVGDLLIEEGDGQDELINGHMDQVLSMEAQRSLQRPEDMNGLHLQDCNSGVNLVVFKGDITTVATSAIVNAANEGGLGCFNPQHRCVDNVIHRAAGPRLRQACHTALGDRPGNNIATGAAPLVTPAFALPSEYVLHVVGPCVERGKPTVHQQQQLADCYTKSLDAAHDHNMTSIAFPCVSTGLFGFPAEQAANIALGAVQDWLQDHDNTPLQWIVFNTFTESDHALYSHKAPRIPGWQPMRADSTLKAVPSEISAAAALIEQADAVLVCAGAGMGFYDDLPNNVYVSPDDFERHYPGFAARTGYSTAYECMGLMGDPRVPEGVKWGFWLQHMNNMRWNFPPSRSYELLWNLIKDKEYAVHTSNVDGCFLRSNLGPAEVVYRPQGDWEYIQCTRACTPNSYWPSRPLIEELLPKLSRDGVLPQSDVPVCPNCGGTVFGNVRASRYFLHEPYAQAQDALLEWVGKFEQGDKKLVVIEIGAGFNTPTVTRWPMEALVNQLGDRGALVRINPTEPEIPNHLTYAVGIKGGWEVLGDIAARTGNNRTVEVMEALKKTKRPLGGSSISSRMFAPPSSDFKTFLSQLRR